MFEIVLKKLKNANATVLIILFYARQLNQAMRKLDNFIGRLGLRVYVSNAGNTDYGIKVLDWSRIHRRSMGVRRRASTDYGRIYIWNVSLNVCTRLVPYPCIASPTYAAYVKQNVLNGFVSLALQREVQDIRFRKRFIFA